MNTTVQQAIDLLNGFDEKEQRFALNVLRQIPSRCISGDSYVCEFGYVHGEYNADTVAAMEETEEIIQQINSGKRKPLSLEAYLAETRKWLEEDVEDEAV
ncbi:MAG: hypothetical protein FWD03_00975 [Defluviitaleaceae bacterium]|nr:hypothetical protein [Defluviitaleaceae bacterium]